MNAYVCTKYLPGSHRSQKKGLDSLRTRVTGGYVQPHGYWGSNPDPLEEWPGTLAAELALRTSFLF